MSKILRKKKFFIHTLKEEKKKSSRLSPVGRYSMYMCVVYVCVCVCEWGNYWQFGCVWNFSFPLCYLLCAWKFSIPLLLLFISVIFHFLHRLFLAPSVCWGFSLKLRIFQSNLIFHLLILLYCLVGIFITDEEKEWKWILLCENTKKELRKTQEVKCWLEFVFVRYWMMFEDFFELFLET